MSPGTRITTGDPWVCVRGDFDKIQNASVPAGLGLEDASATQPKLSPSSGFSSVSFLFLRSLLGTTQDPTFSASSCLRAGKRHPLAFDE